MSRSRLVPGKTTMPARFSPTVLVAARVGCAKRLVDILPDMGLQPVRMLLQPGHHVATYLGCRVAVGMHTGSFMLASAGVCAASFWIRAKLSAMPAM